MLHTVEASAPYSAAARRILHGFRNALYFPHVDFHVGDVSGWAEDQLRHRGGKPFLAHAVLDMPSSHAHLAAVGRALLADGALIAFNPSVTQIAACVRSIKENNLPLVLETVLELGNGGGSGGREWDVRMVRPRAADKATREAIPSREVSNEPAALQGRYRQLWVTSDVAAEDDKLPSWEMVCRPKVGDRIVGGGFLGIWRKMGGRDGK